MRIGVELVHITEGVTGGLVPYLQGVLQALFSGWPDHEVVLFERADAPPLFGRLPPHVHGLRLPTRLYFPLLDVQSFALGLDVLFRSYPYDAELAFPSARQVFLIPDAQHEFHPEFFTDEALQGRRVGFLQALAHGGAVVTLSEHARRTLLASPGARDAEVFVAPPALLDDADGGGDLTGAERALLPANAYFLYPANLWPHKNHRRLLQAFARFLEGAGRPFELILTGHPAGWQDIAKEFPGLPVRHLGFVRRPLLRALLARARALVFFSLFEGFGMPLLEAFAAGTPVACSASTSLPEVGGDAVLSCDPTDIGAISLAMARVDGDAGLRGRLVARGKERLGAYDWQGSAAQFLRACALAAGRRTTPAAPPLPSIRCLNESIRAIDEDRDALRAQADARLDAIHRLTAETETRLDAIHQLTAATQTRLEAIHKLNAALQLAEAELHRARHTFPARAGRAIRGLARRLLGPVKRLAGVAAPAPQQRIRPRV